MIPPMMPPMIPPSWLGPSPGLAAEAAPAAVSDAPAAITAPAAMRATRSRVFFVMYCYPQ